MKFFTSVKAKTQSLDRVHELSIPRFLALKAKLTFSNWFSGWIGQSQSGAPIWPWRFANSRIDYSAEVGDLRLSSLVMSGVGWVERNLNSARLQVVEIGSDRKETEVEDSPLIDLWNEPNEYYDSSTLLDGIALSWLTFATAYILKIRTGSGDLMSTAGRVRELWWEPHWSIRPRWPQNGTEFISYYEIYRNGQYVKVHPDNVIAIRYGIDMDTRCGMSRMSCLLREFYTDQQASGLMAVLLRNGLVPPLVVSLGDSNTPFTGSTSAIKEELVRKMTGDSAGEPLVISGRARAEKLGYDYSGFGFREIRKVPQELFCSVMGISPISLNWTGETRDTFDNVRQYLANDYRSYIVPLHSRIARALKKNLLGEFGFTDDLEVRWDYSQTPPMQRDKAADSKIATEQWQANGITRGEYREAIGYKPDPVRDDVFFADVSAAGSPFDLGLPEPESVNNKRFLKARPTKKDKEEGAEWWRKNPYIPDDAKDLIDADVEPVKPNGGTR